ncbi:MAG: YwbE family protein [Candidatus Kapaibacterium sp.]
MQESNKQILIGQKVLIVQKHHQISGELTEGIVSKILTKSKSHPHGIKVRLESGEVGRVKKIFPLSFPNVFIGNP